MGVPEKRLVMVRKNSKKYRIAKRLGEIYLALKELSGELQEFAEDHELGSIGNMLLDDIKKIEQADHDLIRVAHKLIKEGGN